MSCTLIAKLVELKRTASLKSAKAAKVISVFRRVGLLKRHNGTASESGRSQFLKVKGASLACAKTTSVFLLFSVHPGQLYDYFVSSRLALKVFRGNPLHTHFE